MLVIREKPVKRKNKTMFFQVPGVDDPNIISNEKLLEIFSIRVICVD